MAAKLDLEARMTIKKLEECASTAHSIAEVLGVTEGAVRFHLRRRLAGAEDGRSREVHLAGWDAAIVSWLEGRGPRAPTNLVALHAWLMEGMPIPAAFVDGARNGNGC